MPMTVVRPGETIPAKVVALDPALPIDGLSAQIRASLSSPTCSYVIERNVNNEDLIIAQHHLLYPDRLPLVKADLLAKHEQDIQFLYRDNQFLRHEAQELLHETQELCHEQQLNLTSQLHWQTRARIAQALNDTYVRQLLHQEEYVNLKLNGHNYLPVVLSSWAVYTDREPATRLIGMDEIDDEAMDIHFGKGATLRRNGLEESVEFVWDSIPELERNIMISMFLTRPPNRTGITHPKPTVGEGRRLIHLDHRIPQAEKDFITNFIPNAKDKKEKHLFSSD